MAIIKHIKEDANKYPFHIQFPDQFKTEKEKENPDWIKGAMDYFSNKGYAEYVKNRETFVKNYDLVKGILHQEDFYMEEEVKSFTEILTKDMGLPAYVKHYSIITTPLNELVGELTKRPDDYKVKAFDDDSKSEELDYKTQLLNEYILTEARIKIQETLALQGQEISDEEIEQLTLEEVKDEIESYTSKAEKWGNHILTCQKADFNIKEMSEDAFRDLSISAREYYHIYEDNSKLGYNVVVENPKNVWHLTTPDRKFTSDPTGRARGAYAAGTVNVMEISEIIENVPDLTKEEIDHLRKGVENFGLINVRESNLFDPNVKPGWDSVKYDTYDPLILQERAMAEANMKDNNDSLQDFLGLSSNVSAFGYKYVVVKAYWISKKKIGKVIYEDELGNEQTILVDENYKSGTIPSEISIEWGWINQWYQGIKVGPDIYHVKPLKILNYCPIIGVNFEIKNTEAKSIIDMMKPFQVLYNICLNQLYQLLEKEIGNIANINIRRIPKLKDGDDQDAVDMWMLEAKERGISFDDDSPENTKAPMSNTTIAKNIDLTRSNEMTARINMADWLKSQCWELVGMNRERLGTSAPSATATATQSNLQQSYAQTEPLFVAHEYVLGQLYQAIIDASLYIESHKPLSTLSYINSKGTSAFVQVNGSDLKLRDLKVFPTNRPEDKRLFEEIRSLAHPLLQNGGSFHDVIALYSTDSIRQMEKVFKVLRDKQEEIIAQNQQIEQQKIDQQAQIAQKQAEQLAYENELDRAHESYEKELDRVNKKEVAIISALGFGKVEGEDSNSNEIPDLYEANKLSLEKDKVTKAHQSKLLDIQNKYKLSEDKMKLEREKLQVARENMNNDLQIAKINAKNRSKQQKAKPKKK
jgi:hypothetical protein